jgi:hypothetical protein
MKDLGTLLGLNLDSNLKKTKDNEKDFDAVGDRPKEAGLRHKDLKGPKKPGTGKQPGRKFRKISKKLNVEKIPGSK